MVEVPYLHLLDLECDVQASRTVGYQGMDVKWKRNAYIIVDSIRADWESLRYTGKFSVLGQGRQVRGWLFGANRLIAHCTIRHVLELSGRNIFLCFNTV